MKGWWWVCVDPTKESYSEAESCHTLVMATTLLSCRGMMMIILMTMIMILMLTRAGMMTVKIHTVPQPIIILSRPRLSMWLAHIVVSLVLSVTMNRVYHSIIVDFWVFLGYIPCILWTEKRLKQMLKCSVPARPPASAITPSPCETWARETLDF